MTVEPKSPVFFDVNVTRLPAKGMPVVIEADEKQRRALAEAHMLEAVEFFRADLVVSRWKRNGVRVDGHIEAEILQACVITLQAIRTRISEPVSGLFLPDDSKLGREGFETGGEILINVDGPDSPELFTGDKIDVGAFAEEFFGLAIDPYPRLPGASVAAAVPVDEQVGQGQLAEKLRALFPKP